MKLIVMAVALAAMLQAALPEPPHQHDPWTPPIVRGIPGHVVEVAGRLFDAGLADPRDGAYREVQISAWDGVRKSAPETHGWVFESQYAVLWNGLVYRVQKAGASADLEADVRAITGANPWAWMPFRPASVPPDPPFLANTPKTVNGIASISIALLLRIGKGDLAEKLWQAPDTGTFSRRVSNRTENETQSLESWAMAWLGTAFLRLIDEHAAGNDDDALDTAQSLVAWEERLQSGNQMPASATTFSFLNPVPAMLADSRRRLQEPARPKLDLQAILTNSGDDSHTSAFLKSPQAARIATLIDRLEDVRGAKLMFPGPYVLMFDPVCELLSREGEAAVEPLLDVYEHDRRFTRGADYARPWYLERTPITVAQAAQEILDNILHFKSVVQESTPAQLRAWWEKNKKNPLDRSFDLLASDSSSPDEWLESAELITLRSDLHPFGLRGVRQGDCTGDNAAPTAAGESLRNRKAPSVSGLLAKRTAALASSIQPERACRMAFMAYTWDPKASLLVLQSVSGLEACRKNALVTAARIELGDSQAAADWAALTRKSDSPFPIQTTDLSPLWMFPADAALSQLAEWLFARPQSTLAPDKDFQRVATPLLIIPAYRRAVFSGLGNDSVAGSATRDSEKTISISYQNGGGGYGLNDLADERHVKLGEKRPIRVKDLLAWELSTIAGFPEFSPDWSETDKDIAAAKVREFLQLHESELRAFPSRPQDAVCISQNVFLAH